MESDDDYDVNLDCTYTNQERRLERRLERMINRRFDELQRTQPEPQQTQYNISWKDVTILGLVLLIVILMITILLIKK